MDGVGDLTGGSRVDGRAVDEEAFGGFWEEGRFENIVEDSFDVGGFRKDGYNRFLKIA